MKPWSITTGTNATYQIASTTRKLIDNGGSKRGKYILIYRFMPVAGRYKTLKELTQRPTWTPYIELVEEIYEFDTVMENGKPGKVQIGLYKCKAAKR